MARHTLLAILLCVAGCAREPYLNPDYADVQAYQLLTSFEVAYDNLVLFMLRCHPNEITVPRKFPPSQGEPPYLQTAIIEMGRRENDPPILHIELRYPVFNFTRIKIVSSLEHRRTALQVLEWVDGRDGGCPAAQ
jgi:hypothetical protein